MPNLRNGSKGGFEPGLTCESDVLYPTELPRSTVCILLWRSAKSVQNSNGFRKVDMASERSL